MTETNTVNRVTCKHLQPNQRLLELLESLYLKAVEEQSPFASSLKQAISSLEKYPLPITSGAECLILKGFDHSLCQFLDSHIHELNKKTKLVNDATGCEESGSGPSSCANIDTKVKMASAPAKKHIKRGLVTNIEKNTFFSKFCMARFNNASKPGSNSLSTDAQSVQNNRNVDNRNPTLGVKPENSEKNNNTIQSHCSDEMCIPERKSGSLDTYFVNRKIPFSDSWDSFTYKDCQPLRKKCNNTDIRKCYQPVQVIDPDTDSDSNSDNSIMEISSSSEDESTVQPTVQQHVCRHNTQVLNCKQCESISTAADVFHTYYKDKKKKDAEETDKYNFPRNKYKPTYRSGAYAILVTLLEQYNECPYRDSLTKDELVQKAQKHSDKSFIHRETKPYSTIWANLNMLISKGIVQINYCAANGEDVYNLTAMGRAIAVDLMMENTPNVTVNDVIFHGQRNDRVPSLEDVVLIPPPPPPTLDEEQNSLFIELPPGTFDIVMLIDKRENLSANLPVCRSVKYESRSLSIGDFLWVARCKKTGIELVLPYIVERKRMDDLASSIKDGRFHEQKFRLRKCGSKHVVYLVEGLCDAMTNCGLPKSTLSQAMANTCVQEQFSIVRTSGLSNTFTFLGTLSESVSHEFSGLVLRGCNKDTQGKELMTFEFFNKFSSKNKPLTVKDTFIKMLLQLKGLSEEKALAITNKYNTPNALMKAYEKLPVKEGEILLADLKYNQFTCKVGPAVSKTVYQLLSTLEI